MNMRLNYKNLLRGVLIVFPIFLVLMMGTLYKEKIVIEAVSPNETILGESFYVSVTGSGFQNGDTIYINDQPQNTTFGNTGWITCVVDASLYQEPGNLEVRVVRGEGKKIIVKSNTAEIKVIEK